MRTINGKIHFKVLYFGTALAGKTTSLKWICENVIPASMKNTDTIRSVNTSFGQTMLFDFIPIKISENINFRLFTATGQDYYAGTRKLLFQDIDGVFFVVDSQKKELQHNKEFVDEFNRHLTHFNLLEKNVTVIVLYNKQDLEDIYSTDYLKKELKLEHYPGYPTCALTGQNLKESFAEMIKKCVQKMG